MTLPRHPYRCVWRWELDVSPETLWPLVADTDRFNRDTGLPTVEDARREDDVLGPGRHMLRIRVLGVPVEWEESPFEWVAPHRFGVIRRYRRGPLHEMRVQVELEAIGASRTALTYRVDARPRGLLGWVTVPVQIGFVSRRAFGRAFRAYADEASAAERAARESPSGFPAPATDRRGDALTALALARLRSVAARLLEQGKDAGSVERLVRLVREADDADLARIRPYALADAWGVDRRATLDLLLRAAREGMLDLRWEVICPLCHGTTEESDALDRLPPGTVHCDGCMVDFAADLERSVELAFVPAAGIRPVRAGAYCVAGPRTTPHVLVQQLLGPGESRRIAAKLATGRYRARTFDGRRAEAFDVVEGGPDEIVVELPASGPLRATPAAAGPVAHLTLSNDTATEQLLMVERTGWGEDSATAAEVIVLQEFRDLFSRQVLAGGRSAGVGTLTVLFTDLKGSTALYQSLGDGPAFDRVVDHFRILREAIEPERGSVVKTIGDAVMAVFIEPAGALRAAVRAHRAVAAMTAAPSLVLKAALHTGTCIAVTLNERLDYFGSTVNVAARLADLSHGGDVVMSDAVRSDPGVEATLADGDLRIESFRAPIRGIEGEADLWRVRWP